MQRWTVRIVSRFIASKSDEIDEFVHLFKIMTNYCTIYFQW